jgi:hypothetical protein
MIMPPEWGGHMDTTRRATSAASVIGAFGLGAVFGPLVTSAVRGSVEVPGVYLSTEVSWVQLALPMMLLVALAVGYVSGRFGWLVAAVALLAAFAIRTAGLQFDDRRLDWVLIPGLFGAVALGGGLGVFGASKEGRLGWVWGFAAGGSGQLVVYAFNLHWSLEEYMRYGALLTILPFAVLCLVAAVLTLVSGPGASVANPTRTWGALAVVPCIAVVALGLRLGMNAELRRLTTTGDIEKFDEIGTAVLAGAVALVFAVYAYGRGGAPVARWVLVGFGYGLASDTGGTRASLFGWQWLWPLVLIAGVVVGIGVARRTREHIPWDAIALVGLAVAVVVNSPRGITGMDASASGLVFYASSFMMAFALAAGLGLLVSQPGADLSAVGLGLAALLTTVAIVWRPQLVLPGIDDMRLPNGIAVGLAGLAVLGLARLARPMRPELMAEASAS